MQLNAAWLEELAGRRYDVIGSLDDLRPDPPPAPGPTGASTYLDPDDPPLDQLTDAALISLVALLQQAAALRVEVGDLHGEIDRLWGELHQARREVGLSLRVRRAIIRRCEARPAGRFALRVYRRVKRPR